MVRRTKQEAQATRSHILDTAELVFERHGVSGTSLTDIAQAAGLTRGAIYWHFQNKADLFNAMMERVTLPLEEADGEIALKGPDLTLAQIRNGFVDVLRRISTEPQLRRVFDIATHKVEYVGEMIAVRERHLAMRNECLADMERALRRAVASGELPKGMPPRHATVGLLALFDGLLQNWMLDREAFDLLRVGRRVLDAYLRGLKAPA
ncbi:MAG: TetR family transcriptional regulator [Pseudomonadota bacterium]|nr:TetR family transcriptional regulator [Pseudomonadota bacterium]